MKRANTSGIGAPCVRTGSSTRRRGRRVIPPLLALAVLALLVAPATAFAVIVPTFDKTDYSTGDGPTWVTPADVNEDGDLDLVVVNDKDSTLVVLAGDGDGGFATLSTTAIPGPDADPALPAGPYCVEVARLNGDAHLDVAVVNRTSKTMAIFSGDGAGGFTLLPQSPTKDSYVLATEPICVKAVDLDKDGDRDLVCTSMWNAVLSPFYNNGSGRFTRIDVELPDIGSTVLGVGDLNEDGWPDVAVNQSITLPPEALATEPGTSEYILLNDGAGTLKLHLTLTVGSYPQGATFSDFNDDGHKDICVTSRYPNRANVYFGNGTGSFAAAATYTVGQYAKVPIAVDLNLDGAQDLAVCNYGDDDDYSTTISVLTGKGDGSFNSQFTVVTGGKPHAIESGDFNEDGVPDLVIPNWDGDTVSVLLNTTDLVAPTTTDDAPTGWQSGPITVNFTATDNAGGTGVKSTQYQLDGGAWTTGTSCQVETEGNHTLKYRSTDFAGNQESTKETQVKLDWTAPVTSASPNDSGWHASPLDITLTPSDAGTIDYTEYRKDGGAWVKGAALTFTAHGSHTLEYRSRDLAGHLESTKSLTTKVDARAPVTLASGDKSGWHNHSLSITLTASDVGVGLKETVYRIDGGDWIAGTAIAIAAQGKHTVTYYSSDLFDRAETEHTLTVGVDTKRPWTRAPYPASVRRFQRATLKYTVKDGTPSCGKANVRIDIKTYSGKLKKRLRYYKVATNKALTARFVCKLPKGRYRFYVYATDIAGNVQSKVDYHRLTVK